MHTIPPHPTMPQKKARCFTSKSDFRQIKICLNPIISNAIFLLYHQNKPTSTYSLNIADNGFYQQELKIGQVFKMIM